MEKYTSCKQAIEHCINNKYFAVAYLCNEEKTMNIHIHDCYEMYFSITGGKQFLIDNKFYDIDSGDLFVINQFESHYLTKIDQMVHERIVVSIHPEFVKMLSSDKTDLSTCFTKRTTGCAHRLHLSAEQQKRFHYYINKITSVDSFGSDIIEKACFMELLVMINSIYMENLNLDSNVSDYKYNQQVEQIIQYINQNICEPITIEYLAKHFYLSDSYICRIFKSATGTTINKYITARRISIAKSLLSSGMSVSDVYSQSGFNDYSNFLKAFTKAVGVSPKKYALYSNS
ncbi:AraC family transcriptional regulator [Anaerosporobacter faecicola]|uniref:AraC family transcriptional regulator n=1 Tax=Anaerosporobacter faecicola TaxID=2718714 RepID=UPI00143CBAF7|nr:AraC family transcriptional regulator [Anaerosporobacter faecicola]